ncbi:MAG: Uma2 family endonuclease [Lachnospiraceae bacterium]|nr:Uma2 family endonuclease [Lachnospiraceae bacterium]
MNNLILPDMEGAYIEHSMVITNFVSIVSAQLKNSLCRVFPDNVQYTWWFGDEKKTIIPDVSINCQVRSRRGNTFVNAPQFVMEVLSDSTEKYDRTEKKDIYRKEEINEYWIVDWRKRKVEIYNLDYDENQEPQYYLFQTITESNKEELKLIHFPHVKIGFDMLFDIEY